MAPAMSVLTSRWVSRRASSVAAMSDSARTRSPPERCWMASVETRTASSREGIRSPRFSIARSKGWPMRISSSAICSSVLAGSSSSCTAIP